MFSVNTDSTKRLERDLKTMARKALPFATKATMNAGGFQMRREWQSQIDDKMVQRNKFTRNSIRVVQTRSLNPATQRVVVGSTAPYMEDQEYGGTKLKKSKEGVPIATGFSAGQRNAQPRTRLPRKPNKLANIQLNKRRKAQGVNKRQHALMAVKQAKKERQKYVYLETYRTKAIFRVLGTLRRPKIEMVHDLSRTSVRIPPNPTMVPAANATRRAMPLLYRAQLIFQLRRRGLFRSY